ncbi:sulfatase family protein [Galbibacter mesophilus]|uniref:sulfatase family protein n=1 Tax=Galbibacter mesophilus TaxID=379069 RepID=UPI00191E7829|nr:sulfatase [Galbibacter mesophilus]MCM5663864.1 sulfatase [Galbibacter mesophilus]
MKKTQKLFLLILAIAFISCSRSPKKEQSLEVKKRPNIIFLLSDDQRADAIGFAENEDVQTPNIDRLAKEGTYFKNAYVTTSICAVSRASILTGQYARKHKIWGFQKNFSKEQLENTYPLILRQNGYTTGFIGKYGVGHALPKEEFDYWKGFAGQGSFKQINEKGDSIHLTKKIEGQAITFLNSQIGSNKPFCLSVSFKAPHVEGDPGYFLPDESYTNLFKDAKLAVPETSKQEFFNHFPDNFTKNNVARNRWEDRFKTAEMQQENIKKYYELIYGIDTAIGNILKSLKENGQDKNTIIIFSSDNGFYLGEYGFAGKWYGSDPSIRVPLIIYHPENQNFRSKIISKMALNIDIAPTILGFAGIEAPKDMQGKDLRELIENPNISWRKEFFYEHLWQSSPAYYIPSTEGIVDGNTKYMLYFKNRDTASVVFEELYKLNEDPNETNNLANNNKFIDLKRKLKRKMAKLKINASK